MINFIKNIEAEIIEEKISNIGIASIVNGVIGLEDYVDVYNFKGFLQNFTKVYHKEEYKVNYKGVLSNIESDFIELEIDYNDIFDCYKLGLLGYDKYGFAIFTYNGETIQAIPNAECCSIFGLLSSDAPDGKYYCSKT